MDFQLLQSLQGALCGAAASTAANGAGKKDKKKKGKKVGCLPARGSPPKQSAPWLTVLNNLDICIVLFNIHMEH